MTQVNDNLNLNKENF